LISLAAYLGLIIIRVKLNPGLAPTDGETYTWEEKFRSLREALPVVLLMVGVMGGLFMGLFTPTEAGAAGAFLAFLIAAVRRALSWEVFKKTIVETVVTSTSIFIIAVGASMLARFIALSGVGT